MCKVKRMEEFIKIVVTHIDKKDMNSLKLLLNTTEEYDLLTLFEELSLENQVIVYRLLSKIRALYIFERLDTLHQERLIQGFTNDVAIETLEDLEPDERVKLLDELPATFAKKMIASLSIEEREKTNLLMGYDPRTAGRIMTPEFVRISRNITVAEALSKVKISAKSTEAIYTLYVTDDSRKLEGEISLRDLLATDPSIKIEDIIKRVISKVVTYTPQEEVAKLLQKLDLLAVPVVDKEGRLVGVVTIDDAVDILEDEATDDILDAAGFADIAGKEADRSEILTKGNIFSIWLVRLPFLMIALAGGLLAGFIMEGFEDILESVVVVAFFIPLIMDMGGSVGTQSTTVFARGVVLGHINIKHFWTAFFKETFVGLSMGLIVGMISWIIITLWLGLPMLGLAVGLGLTSTMTIAALLGFLVPYVLIKLKADQAAGSAPIITTLKDLTGILIYFGLIVTLLGSDFLEPDYEITGMYVIQDGIHFFVEPSEEIATVIGIEHNHDLNLVIPSEIEVIGEIFEVVDTP